MQFTRLPDCHSPSLFPHTYPPPLSLSLSLHSRLSRDSCLLCNLLQAGFLVRLTNTRPHETFSPFPRFFLVLFLLKKKKEEEVESQHETLRGIS